MDLRLAVLENLAKENHFEIQNVGSSYRIVDPSNVQTVAYLPVSLRQEQLEQRLFMAAIESYTAGLVAGEIRQMARQESDPVLKELKLIREALQKGKS